VEGGAGGHSDGATTESGRTNCTTEKGSTMSKRIFQAVLAAAIAGASITATGGVAHADTGCSDRSTRAAFQQWGDNAEYFAASNGGFESGTADWVLTGGATTVMGEQEPWTVNGPGQQSLHLPRRATAQIRMCVKSNEDALRFFWKVLGSSGNLRIDITVDDSIKAKVVNNTSLAVGGLTAWQVAGRVNFPQIRDANGQLWITVKFSNQGMNPILLDDVMVDPWSTN
jgi:hypothetical protein